MLIVGTVILAALALTLPVLTGIGDRRRGHALPHNLLAGLFFPATWASWYLRDERPYRRSAASPVA